MMVYEKEFCNNIHSIAISMREIVHKLESKDKESKKSEVNVSDKILLNVLYRYLNVESEVGFPLSLSEDGDYINLGYAYYHKLRVKDSNLIVELANPDTGSTSSKVMICSLDTGNPIGTAAEFLKSIPSEVR